MTHHDAPARPTRTMSNHRTGRSEAERQSAICAPRDRATITAKVCNISRRQVFYPRDISRYGCSKLFPACDAKKIGIVNAAWLARNVDHEAQAYVVEPATPKEVMRRYRAARYVVIGKSEGLRRLEAAWRAAGRDERQHFLDTLAEGAS